MGTTSSSATELHALGPRKAKPWPELVTLVAEREGLPDQGLIAFERCEEQIDGLTESPEAFWELCPAAREPMSCRICAAWAEELLEQQPGLKEARFRLVPQKISEEVGSVFECVFDVAEAFWDRYLEKVFGILEAELLKEPQKSAPELREPLGTAVRSLEEP